jgi:hypothetical protein
MGIPRRARATLPGQAFVVQLARVRRAREIVMRRTAKSLVRQKRKVLQDGGLRAKTVEHALLPGSIIRREFAHQAGITVWAVRKEAARCERAIERVIRRHFI